MSFDIQNQIKNNAQDIRNYVSDLYEWQRSIQLKQQAKKKAKKQTVIQEPEILKIQQPKIEKQKNKQKKKQLIRDKNTVSGYYKAWDQFDVDQQLNKIEKEEQRLYKPYNPYQNAKNYVRAKPKAQMKIKGGRQVIKDPTSLKDKGNLHYKVCQYEKAIQNYTQCLEKLNEAENSEQNRKLKALVLSNRAMAYVKINQRVKALEDCNNSINYDPKYQKSYLRRADCYRKMGKLKQALLDYQILQQFTPNDQNIKEEIKKIQIILINRVKEAAKSFIVDNIPQLIPQSYRIQIQQADKLFNYQNGQESKSNYLEEL